MHFTTTYNNKNMKEERVFKVMELSGDSLITHDDRLLVRAQKHKIGLEADWRDQVEITYRDGIPVIVNYVRTKDGETESVSPQTWEDIPYQDRETYYPQFLRGLKLAEGVTVSFLNNQMDLRICNLMEDWRSRYRMALEYMVTLTEKGVIRYKPQVEPAQKNMVEAIRNRLKRHGKPTEYEHDILIKGELGRRIHEDLRDHATHTIGSTYYLQGYNRHKDTEVAVKCYDIGTRDGEASGEYFKIETTLLKDYFKHNTLTVASLTEQPEIQGLMMDKLVQVLTRVFGKLTWEVQVMMAQALQLELTDQRKAPAMLARATLQTERTLTERVDRLERDMREVKQRVARLEKDRK